MENNIKENNNEDFFNVQENQWFTFVEQLPEIGRNIKVINADGEETKHNVYVHMGKLMISLEDNGSFLGMSPKLLGDKAKWKYTDN